MVIRRSVVVLALVVGVLVPATHGQPPHPRAPDMLERMPPLRREGPPAVQAPVPWTDVHLHLIGGRGPQEDYPGAVDVAIREMDRFGIAMAIVLPPPQVDAQSVYDTSVFAAALPRHRGRLAYLGGGGALNPIIHRYAGPAGVTDTVKRDFAAAADAIIDAGAVGFGEMASLHISAAPGHSYEFVPADHPLFRVLADVAARRDVPIDLHMDAVEGEMPTPSRFAAHANPPKLAGTMDGLSRLLAHNPKARIVWAHGGSDPLGGMTAAAVGRLMDARPNFLSLLPPDVAGKIGRENARRIYKLPTR